MWYTHTHTHLTVVRRRQQAHIDNFTWLNERWSLRWADYIHTNTRKICRCDDDDKTMEFCFANCLLLIFVLCVGSGIPWVCVCVRMNEWILYIPRLYMVPWLLHGYNKTKDIWYVQLCNENNDEFISIRAFVLASSYIPLEIVKAAIIFEMCAQSQIDTHTLSQTHPRPQPPHTHTHRDMFNWHHQCGEHSKTGADHFTWCSFHICVSHQWRWYSANDAGENRIRN